MENQGALAILKAPGINAAGRADRVLRRVNGLKGIVNVDINYILDTVSIRYDPDKVTLAEIRKAAGTR